LKPATNPIIIRFQIKTYSFSRVKNSLVCDKRTLEIKLVLYL
jgi:hypothetical protein